MQIIFPIISPDFLANPCSCWSFFELHHDCLLITRSILAWCLLHHSLEKSPMMFPISWIYQLDIPINSPFIDGFSLASTIQLLGVPWGNPPGNPPTPDEFLIISPRGWPRNCAPKCSCHCPVGHTAAAAEGRQSRQGRQGRRLEPGGSGTRWLSSGKPTVCELENVHRNPWFFHE